MISAINIVMPRAPVPVVVTREVEDARAGHVQSDIVIVRELVKKMAGIRSLVPAPAVVGAPHVRAFTDPLIRPSFPLPISVQTDRYNGRFPRINEPAKRGDEQETN